LSHPSPAGTTKSRFPHLQMAVPGERWHKMDRLGTRKNGVVGEGVHHEADRSNARPRGYVSLTRMGSLSPSAQQSIRCAQTADVWMDNRPLFPPDAPVAELMGVECNWTNSTFLH
jgi:hypothetical protein